MNKSADFHLFYDRSGNPKVSISIGNRKSKSLIVNKAFLIMLKDLEARIRSFDEND